MGARFGHHLPFGAGFQAGGAARFRLWAPAQEAVQLELNQAAPQPMQALGDGWFELHAACEAGAPYRYVLADGRRVPDPASRAQAAEVHGPSLVVDPFAHQWQHTAWRGRPWEEAVVYELHVGLCGGFAGVQHLLPRLAELGVTAVELMPVAAFSGRRNWGYDGVLPFAPASAYGTPDQLKALVDSAHGLRLMMFLDVVYNHFGPDGDDRHRYAPQFFREDRRTPWGPAIDFRRSEVREYFVHNALYWLLEYRFDGLRLDAVHAIGEPDWLDEAADRIRENVEPGRHVHLMLESEANVARHLEGAPAQGFDAQWNDDAHNALHVLLTGEREGHYLNYAGAPAAKLARCLAEGFADQGEACEGAAAAGVAPGDGARGTPSAHLPPSAFILFLQNHDQVGNRALGERLTLLAEAEALRAAAALQLLCPQIPLLFMGEEWGCRRPFLFFTDFHDGLAEAVREGRRAEFARYAAFADPQARARIPDPNDESTFAASMPDFAAADSGAGAQRLAEYRGLLALRHQHIVPRLIGARSLGAMALADAALSAAWQLGDGAALNLVSNLGATAVDVTPARPRLLYESRAGAAEAVAAGRLPAHSTVAFLDPPAA